MPDNVIYYQLAYGAVIALFVGYAVTLVVRRRGLARRRERQHPGAP